MYYPWSSLPSSLFSSFQKFQKNINLLFSIISAYQGLTPSPSYCDLLPVQTPGVPWRLLQKLFPAAADAPTQHCCSPTLSHAVAKTRPSNSWYSFVGCSSQVPTPPEQK